MSSAVVDRKGPPRRTRGCTGPRRQVGSSGFNVSPAAAAGERDVRRQEGAGMDGLIRTANHVGTFLFVLGRAPSWPPSATWVAPAGSGSRSGRAAEVHCDEDS